jgi:hippurate hydrolase
MHACGHDVHMTAWIGAATLLSRNRNTWHGTLVFVGQPAEEVVQGAKRMIRDGLFTRFPKPDVALGIHVDPTLPAGEIGIAPGPAYAASSSVDITFYGRGGHGATPQVTIDPIVMAARAVVSLQTIVAREVNPLDPAVVTVGTFHAGTKRNIIPDQAQLALTVRSFKPEVQKHLLAAIERIAKGEAATSGATREPAVVVDSLESADVVYNDPKLTGRLIKTLRKRLGDGNVNEVEPKTGSEDFGVYGQSAGIPGVQMRIGASNPTALAQAGATGAVLPGLHTAKFAPDREPTIRTAVTAFTQSVLEVLGSSK